MFSDKDIAKNISEIILKISGELDETIMIMNNSDILSSEKERYTQVAGQILGIICFDLLNVLYMEHPDLKPPSYILPKKIDL